MSPTLSEGVYKGVRVTVGYRDAPASNNSKIDVGMGKVISIFLTQKAITVSGKLVVMVLVSNINAVRELSATRIRRVCRGK